MRTIRLLPLAALVPLLIRCAFALASQEPPAEQGRREAEYIALQANLFEPGRLTAPSTDVAFLEKALREIRARYAEVREITIPAAWTARTSLAIGLAAPVHSQADALCRGIADHQRVQHAAIGISDADAVTSEFNGYYQITCRGGKPSLGGFVVVEFPGLLHVESLAKRYRELASVASAENNRMFLGGVVPVAASKHGLRWMLTFGRGWGDCPAGCIHREYFEFAVEPNFAIHFLGGPSASPPQ